MNATLQLFAREFSKPAFNLINSRCGSWCEVHMIMWASRQPRLYLFCFVRGVIVHNDMNIQVICDPGVNLLQESQKLFRPMAFVTFSDYGTRSDIKGGKQRSRTVMDIGMGPPLCHAWHHRQNRLLTVKCLNLGLFIHTKHNRLVGWGTDTDRQYPEPCRRIADWWTA